MAQPIQVPQTVPNAPQFQIPTDLVNAYLDRQAQAPRDIANTLNNVGNMFYQRQQQKIQNQMAALKAYADIAGVSGITAANQIAPNIPGGMNTQNLPQDPFAQMQSLPPVQPQQNAPPGTPQNATLPLVQDAYPSQQMAASAQAGHPMHPALAAFHNPTSPVQDPNAAPALPTLAPQMAENNARINQASRVGGSYAANMVKNLSAVNTGLAAQDTAMQAPVKFAQEQANFQQGKAQEQANFDTSQAHQVAGAVAGEVSKQRQKSTATDTAQLALNDFAKTFITKDTKGNHVDLTNPSSLPYVTEMKAKLSQSTSGRMGGEAGGEMLNKSKTLGNTLVGILTSGGRMSPAVATDFVNGIIPPPDAPTPLKIKRLDDIQNLINTVKNGDKNALDTVIATLTGAKGSAIPGR